MKSSYRWMLPAVVIVLLLAVMLVGCGKKGSRPTAGGTLASGTSGGGGVDAGGRMPSIVTPPEGLVVADLPERYQKLFNQPIWNQPLPYDGGDWSAPMPPDPDLYGTLAELEKYEYSVRGAEERSASYWKDQESGFIERGVLTTDPTVPALTPPFYTAKVTIGGRDYDSIIRNYPGDPGLPSNSWSRVNLGKAKATNPQWRGTEEYAMYQLFGSAVDRFAELNYTNIGDPPAGREAYILKEHAFYRWNDDTMLQAFGQPGFKWYDQFIGATSGPGVAAENFGFKGDGKLTQGSVQYFRGGIEDGAAGVDYPYAMFVIMEATDYTKVQQEYIDKPAAELDGGLNDHLKGVPAVPVFGAIANAYRDMNPGNMDAPWEGWLGFPLEGMKDFNGGRPLADTQRKIYRMFGQHFYHGFIWWYDYLQKTQNDKIFPYEYTGTTTWDADGEYIQKHVPGWQYGMDGQLGVRAIASHEIVGAGEPVTFHAITWGGYDTDAGTGLYNDILWNFRDGTVGVGRTVNHIYFELANYEVRCIVINDDDAMTPIRVATDRNTAVDDVSVIVATPGSGGGGGGGGGKIVVADGDNGQASYAAYVASLNALGLGAKIESVSGAPSLADYQKGAIALYANSMYLGATDCQDFTAQVPQTAKQYVDGGGNWVYFNSLTSGPMPYGMSGLFEQSWRDMIGATTAGTWIWEGWAWSSPQGATRNILGSLQVGRNGKQLTTINTGSHSGWIGAGWWYWGQYNGAKAADAEMVHPTPYWGAIGGLLRDNNSSADGGWALMLCMEFYPIQSTQPDAGGKDFVLETVLNRMAPEVFGGGGGGGGGPTGYTLYDGAFELLYVTAHAVAADGTFEGGDGSDGRGDGINSGYNTYNGGTGTVYHSLSAVPPDPADVNLSIVIREVENDEFDHENWQVLINWRDGTPLEAFMGADGKDTYAVTHVYSLGIEPGVNAYVGPPAGFGWPAYGGVIDPNAIYDGSVGDPLYPDLGEDAGDLGSGAPTAIVVHAWNGTGSPWDFGTNAHIGGVVVGIDLTPPAQIYDISSETGATDLPYSYKVPPDAYKASVDTVSFFWKVNEGSHGPYPAVWFDYDYVGVVFDEDLQATAYNGTTGNTKWWDGADWVGTNGGWTGQIDEDEWYRTDFKFPGSVIPGGQPNKLVRPRARVSDPSGPVVYAYTNFPQILIEPGFVMKETWEGGTTVTNADNTWAVSGAQGSRNYDWANVTTNQVLGHGAQEGNRFARWNTGTDATYVGNNAQRWAQTGPFTLDPNTNYRITFYSNGRTAWVFNYYIMAGMRPQYSFNGTTWYDATNFTQFYGYNYAYNIKGIGYSNLSNPQGTWKFHKWDFNSAGNSQIYFRFAFESAPTYGDYSGYPNNGGPCIDNITIYQPPPPQAPIWEETFESGNMNNWTDNGGALLTFYVRSGAKTSGPSGAQGGTYYMTNTPEPYPNNSYRRYTAGPISVTNGSQYDFEFYTGGTAESSWDGLLVGYSFNGTTWTWLGDGTAYGHDYAGYTVFNGSLGGATWSKKDTTFTAGSSTLYIRIGWEADGSVVYYGPTLDSMAVRPASS